MTRFSPDDVLVIGEAAVNRAALYARLGQMLDHSTDIRAEFLSLNMETGEYRVVLKGTLENRPLTDDGGSSDGVASHGAVATSGGPSRV